MNTEWHEEICSDYPQEFEQLNPDSYIQRRNVIDSGQGYICESRIISKKVYDDYVNNLASPSHIANNDNMTIIMEAIADIYELINK
jgi:hypothetical protein